MYFYTKPGKYHLNKIYIFLIFPKVRNFFAVMTNNDFFWNSWVIILFYKVKMGLTSTISSLFILIFGKKLKLLI
jgi:hypothetical protein